VNAYGVKAGWFNSFVDKRVSGRTGKLCDPLTAAHSVTFVVPSFIAIFLMDVAKHANGVKG